MKKIARLFANKLTATVIFCMPLLHVIAAVKPPQEYYQLTVFHFTTTAQQAVLNNYLETALVPALHRAGSNKVGVFSALNNDTASEKKIFVFISFSSLEKSVVQMKKVEADTAYQSAGAAYINASYTAAPYARKEVIWLQAFPLALQMKMPKLKAPHRERVYELRSYESATEKIFANKVHMFNEGDEIGLFGRLNFNAVFYSTVLAGSKMPNLVYMTCFENMQDRDEHWKRFGEDPYWKKISTMPEYQNNVSHIDISFLQPADYSDL